MEGKGLDALTFGFDIGIASVGWCVLGENRIVDLGVRCFDSGEDSDGKPHNQTRRGARVARNRLHMRRWRLRQLLRLFCDAGIIDHPDPKLLMTPPDEDGPWQLRAKGLKEKLEPIEWARVLYHLVKHRGFEFFRKSELKSAQTPDTSQPATSEEKPGKEEIPAEETTTAKEKEKLNKSLEDTGRLLEKYRKPLEAYRKVPLTVGALLVWLGQKDYAWGGPRPDTEDRITSFRNKSGSYRHAFFRAALRLELHELFAAQNRHGNPYTTLNLHADGEYSRHMLAQDNARLTPEKAIPVGSESRPVGQTFQQAVFDLFDLQHPPLYGEQIREMVGKCELIEGQPRASKNAFSSERATWLETLNKLRVRRGGKETPLSAEERAALIDLPYKPHKVTLKLVRETLMAQTGFPASWQEASFNIASYQAKPANDGAWIFIATRDQEPVSLAKWANNKERKDKLKEAKKMLMGSIVPFKELRKQLGLADSDRFVSRIKDTTIIPHDREAYEHLQFPSDGKGLFAADHFYRCISNNGKSKAFPKIALKFAADLRSQSAATLADWRKAIATVPGMSGTWQFEHSISTKMVIEPKDEADTQVPLKFEDAQAVEADHKLVELKGWHALRLALSERCPDKWAQLQLAYQHPTSDEGQNAAHEIDHIATILTEAQTDHEIEKKLRERGCTDEEEIDALKSVDFSKFRNLSLAALYRILPHLEDGHVYSKACELADLSHSEKKAQLRDRRLPPLETYVYQRYRHGRLTGHKENRYKELLNPVVARSFNQARLVFNDLVAKYGSPTYVHVETARDLARSKKMRDKIGREQDTNRKRIESIRNDLKNKIGREPSGEQLLKMRLYLEQNGQCLYTGRSLEPYINAMLTSDENVVEIDHIWPRSKTFDNSLDNRVLVIAGANQNKRNQIPYEFFNGAGGDPRWREFEMRVLACKGISAEKQRRLLSKSLEDADEFLARNLVDTRYATRLFSTMLRERVTFAGGATPEELEAISPDDDGKTRWNRYQRARVRSPQGRLVDFLRGKWGLAHLKDREKSDLHHALDACIIAACSPKTIQQVNNYFAEEEQEPGKHSFKRNSDGTYTHRATGEILGKEEAKERGLYLPAPWKPRDVIDALNKIFVSRRPKRKSATEIHDANPKGIRYLPVPLIHLTEEMLSAEKLREIAGRRRENYETLLSALQAANGDAQVAFADGYEVEGKHGKLKRIYCIAMPLWSLPETYRKQRDKELAKENAKRRKIGTAKLNENLSKTARKTVPLTSLTQKMLTEAELGSTFYQRNRDLIEAFKAHLGDKKAKDAFAQPFQPPPGKKGKERPLIRSIRLPDTHGSGMMVRGGIAGLGESISTEVWMTESGFFFRPRYQAAEEATFGLEEPPTSAKHLFNLRIDEPLEIVLMDGEIIPGNGFPGYFVMYEGDKRIKLRTHDRPGKGKWKKEKSEEETGSEDASGKNEDEKDNTLRRVGVSGIKELKKYRVDALGNYKLVAHAIWSGVA